MIFQTAIYIKIKITDNRVITIKAIFVKNTFFYQNSDGPVATVYYLENLKFENLELINTKNERLIFERLEDEYNSY